jgi:hypothetical protein
VERQKEREQKKDTWKDKQGENKEESERMKKWGRDRIKTNKTNKERQINGDKLFRTTPLISVLHAAAVLDISLCTRYWGSDISHFTYLPNSEPSEYYASMQLIIAPGLSSTVAQVATHLIRIREVPGSNLGQGTLS